MIWDEFQQYVKRNRRISYRVRKIPLSSKGYHRWAGGQLYNHTIYGIPNHEESVLKYHLNKDKEELVGGLSSGTYKWTGGTVYKNVLYGFPRSSNCLLAFDIGTGIVKEIPLGISYYGEHHYGGVCTFNGLVYQPPRDTDHILCIDLNTKRCKKISIKGLNRNVRYCGSMIHPNGDAFFFPERNGKVIRMRLSTEETSFIGNEISPMCFDAKIALDGNIYGFSAYSMGIMKIDVQNEVCVMIQEDIFFGSYGTKMGVNGKLYTVPGAGRSLWEYDPLDKTARGLEDIDDQGKAKFAGGGIDKQGKIYAIPADADMILEYSPEGTCESIPDDIYHAFFHDFY